MRRKHGKRLLLILALGICVWIALVGRLFFVQILHGGEYRQMGRDQQQCELTLFSQRGDIYDRDGVKLAFNLPVKSFYANPREVDNPQRLVSSFDQFLTRPAQSVVNGLNRGSSFVLLARKMGLMESERIESLGIPGVYAQEEMQRFYPGRNMCCQLLGFTDVDNRGLEGLELHYDEELRGTDGWAVVQVDARGRKIPLAKYPREEPDNGQNLVLTIQTSYQAIAEQELERGLLETQSKAGCVILMVPATGEILAMANEPRFDLNCPGLAHPDRRRNRAITDVFEPGSTFKIVTAAAALEEGTQSSEDLIYCEGGQIRVCGKVIRDVEEFGWLTFQQVIEKSSNVGVIKVARTLGEKRLFDYARAFGFGNLTGIDLPGEVKGLLAHPKTWSGLSLSSIAIGHEVAVTPLQLVCAYAAVANGGTMMRPLIVRYVLDERGNPVREYAPQPVRKVVSQETATTLRSFLIKVVENGTGKLAAVKDLTVAGKTGTAFKLKENGSGFATNRFVASFCGFFPAESPRLVGLVVLDEPSSPHSGGRAAAPVFRRIVERILLLPKGSCVDLCIKSPQAAASGRMVVVPDLSGLDRSAALGLLQSRGLVAQPVGEGAQVCHHRPGAGELVNQGTTIQMELCQKRAPSAGKTRIPSVVGLTMREAIRQMKQKGLAVRVVGSGLVIRQTPKAGNLVGEEVTCLLECEPPKGSGNLLAVASASPSSGSRP